MKEVVVIIIRGYFIKVMMVGVCRAERKREGGSCRRRLQKAADEAGVLRGWEAWPVSSGNVRSGAWNTRPPVAVGVVGGAPGVLPTGCHPSLCGHSLPFPEQGAGRGDQPVLAWPPLASLYSVAPGRGHLSSGG